MKLSLNIFLVLTILNFFSCLAVKGAKSKNISIIDFGAIPNDGKLDNEAFFKASVYINKNRGNVILEIPEGEYIIGKQIPYSEKQKQFLFEGVKILSLENCSNVQIIGTKKTKLIYAEGMKFGSFSPSDGQKVESKMPFTNRQFAAHMGFAIYLNNCQNITISNMELDGNDGNAIIGGKWGDKGYQLTHYGIYLLNSKAIIIKNVNSHNFLLDGLYVGNTGKENENIVIEDSKFEYNGRQGLSITGCNGFKISNCKFNNTGKGKVSSAPGAGIDFEPKSSYFVTNGTITNCEFINNTGPQIIADLGKTSKMNFENCTFWGVTSWSAWVDAPSFTFTKCNFYGSFVHGFITTIPEEATKFFNCNFEDKKYNGQNPFGGYLLESNRRKLMVFSGCNFTSNNCNLIWFSGNKTELDNRANFENNTFVVKNNLNKNKLVGVLCNSIMNNNKFIISNSNNYKASISNFRSVDNGNNIIDPSLILQKK
jgi:hypothetical protein